MKKRYKKPLITKKKIVHYAFLSSSVSGVDLEGELVTFWAGTCAGQNWTPDPCHWGG